MLRLSTALPVLALFAFSSPALAAPPPADAKPLSEILKTIEDRETVAYFDEVEWDDDGYWEIEYVRADGAKVKVRIDPVSGQAKR